MKLLKAFARYALVAALALAPASVPIKLANAAATTQTDRKSVV